MRKGHLKCPFYLKKIEWYVKHLIAHVDGDEEKLKTMNEIILDKQFDELHDED